MAFMLLSPWGCTTQPKKEAETPATVTRYGNFPKIETKAKRILRKEERRRQKMQHFFYNR